MSHIYGNGRKQTFGVKHATAYTDSEFITLCTWNLYVINQCYLNLKKLIRKKSTGEAMYLKFDDKCFVFSLLYSQVIRPSDSLVLEEGIKCSSELTRKMVGK